MLRYNENVSSTRESNVGVFVHGLLSNVVTTSGVEIVFTPLNQIEKNLFFLRRNLHAYTLRRDLIF